MTTSRRLADRKIQKFEKNITKRGAVTETTTKKGNDYPVGPIFAWLFHFCRNWIFVIPDNQDGNKWRDGLISSHGSFLRAPGKT